MKLRLEISVDFGRSIECVEETSVRRGAKSLLNGARSLLHTSLCRIGFHKLVMDEEQSCCWGGIDRCTRCGKEERWSNSYP